MERTSGQVELGNGSCEADVASVTDENAGSR